MSFKFLLPFCILLLMYEVNGQIPTEQLHHNEKRTAQIETYQLFKLNKSIISTRTEDHQIKNAITLELQTSPLHKIKSQRDKALNITLPVQTTNYTLELYQPEHLAKDLKIKLASGGTLDLSANLYYWGTVQGDKNSWAALTIDGSGVSGVFAINGAVYNLAKHELSEHYLLFKGDDVPRTQAFSCDVMHAPEPLKLRESNTITANANNCVKVYVEVDNDIVVGKGSVQAAADYVTGAFSQVSLLYSRESINLSLGEMLVWDVADPYTGTSTSTLLNQFTTRLSGNFNGDIAHLVGYVGGGGRAYIDALCSKYYATGFSDINSTYSNIPVYSWTINVLAHEIGHNLGSPHTHDCAWNGNNTAIDGCGNQAGYGGCTGPIPSKGTIMSYCHLLSGVGIDFNLGFGPQPGDLMRSRVYNAPCLTTCSAPNTLDVGISQIISPRDLVCAGSVSPVVRLSNFGSVTLTSVQIVSRSDAGTPVTFQWNGNLSAGAATNVTLAAISIADGTHTFHAYTNLPNNTTDANPTNDASSASYNNLTCDCTPTSRSFSNSNLSHSGSGSTATTLVLEPGSVNPSFTISGLDARLGGTPSQRYDEAVVITYRDGTNTLRTLGTFQGSVQATTNVSINGVVNSLTATLSDAYDGNSPVTLQVSLSAVNYCSSSQPCLDDDGDGVCNEVDACPGFDDRLDADGDGIPDGCDNQNCTSASTSFSTSTLVHTGSGTSFTTATLPAGSSQVSFTISGLSARLNGQQTRRYNEQVQVYYTNSQGVETLYGTFTGDAYSQAGVQLSGSVQAIKIVLSDAYNGGANNQALSVSLSSINYCGQIGGLVGDLASGRGFFISPNPAHDRVTIVFTTTVEKGEIYIMDMLGREIIKIPVQDTGRLELPLNHDGLRSGVFMVTLRQNGQQIQTKKLLIQ